MKLHCSIDSVEALRRGVDVPESAVLDLNPAILSPAEREWLAAAVRKGESSSPEEPAPLIFPYPIPAPSVEGLREAIAARITDRFVAPEHGITTRFSQPQGPRAEERLAPPATPTAAPSHPMGEAAKAAGFMGLGAIMGGMLDRVFGPRPQPPVEIITEPDQPREGSWGESRPQGRPSGESSCCDDQDHGDDSSASFVDDDSDDPGSSGGDYDLV